MPPDLRDYSECGGYTEMLYPNRSFQTLQGVRSKTSPGEYSVLLSYESSLSKTEMEQGASLDGTTSGTVSGRVPTCTKRKQVRIFAKCEEVTMRVLYFEMEAKCHGLGDRGKFI